MHYPNKIEEEICYRQDHLYELLSEIRLNFNEYFSEFIETESGKVPSFKKIKGETSRKKIIDTKSKLQLIQEESILSFEKDREYYLDILDINLFNEYEDDPSFFKNTILRDRCPIIRATLHNKKSKELEKFKMHFKLANPNELLDTIKNIANFAYAYVKEKYDSSTYEKLTSAEQFGFSELDDSESAKGKSDEKSENKYSVLGVIGSGIRSHLLYKFNPEIFPNRSRDAIWALYYLTSKKSFGCKEDSEFLLINGDKHTLHQNYYYPYDLFTFYALQIYLLIKQGYSKHNVYIDESNRYVILNSFLKFISEVHAKDTVDIERWGNENNHDR